MFILSLFWVLVLFRVSDWLLILSMLSRRDVLSFRILCWLIGICIRSGGWRRWMVIGVFISVVRLIGLSISGM